MNQTDFDRGFADFERILREEEKSPVTIRQYLRDVRSLRSYLAGRPRVTKEVVAAYKKNLQKKYLPASVNVKLAAVNRYLRVSGVPECAVRLLKIQRAAFRSRELTREEYLRLLEAARRKGRTRLCLVMQTIASTGIRISELPFITVEAVEQHQAMVSLKGKNRVVLLAPGLCGELKKYIQEKKIREGSIFVTRTGRCLDRSNVLHEMKSLCGDAGVDPRKVFPHNLRHLFAVTYYNATHNLCRLADLMGHSSVNTTRIYTQSSSEGEEKLLEQLGLLVPERDFIKNTA